MKKLLFTALAIIAFAGSNVAQVPNYVPSNGLVGWWPFNGNANDESGNGNDGTVNNDALLIQDRLGNTNAAFLLDGVDDWIQTNTSFLNTDLSHSISIWWMTTDSTKTNQTLFNTSPHTLENLAFHYSSSNSNPPFGISYGMGNGFSESGSWNILHPDNGQISMDGNFTQWHNCVWVKDSIYTWKIYIDGILSANFTSSINTGSQVANLRFGAENNGFPTGGANFKGRLDDIGIWNRALSEQEIQTLYNGCSFAPNEIVGNITPEVFVAESYTCNAIQGSTYQWTISNGVITAGQGTNSVSVLWAGTGLGAISVQETTSANCQGDTISVNVVVIPTGLEEINQSAIKFYPNPANSNMTIDYGNFAMMNGYQLKIQNSLGQQVFQTNISQQTDNLSLSTWGGNGIYFVHIIDPQGNTIDIRKIVLQ